MPLGGMFSEEVEPAKSFPMGGFFSRDDDSDADLILEHKDKKIAELEEYIRILEQRLDQLGGND
jgi:hypothetical protein